MAELITEECPRIKFATKCVRRLECLDSDTGQLLKLSALMHRMEELGGAPILNDNLVGGNCAIAPGEAGHDTGLALVSRSGKAPGYQLQPGDFVLVTSFDRTAWAAEYGSTDPELRPSSDSPLLVAALSCGGTEYGWAEAPHVVLHGHALADGEGLSYASRLGLPISAHATLFSTPEDLAELEALFRSHPYPQHRCYIRRGHGFFLLARSIVEAEQLFTELVEPWLVQERQKGPA